MASPELLLKLPLLRVLVAARQQTQRYNLERPGFTIWIVACRGRGAVRALEYGIPRLETILCCSERVIINANVVEQLKGMGLIAASTEYNGLCYVAFEFPSSSSTAPLLSREDPETYLKAVKDASAALTS